MHGEPSEPGIGAAALARRLAAALGPHVLSEGRAAGLFARPTRRQARGLAACIVRNHLRPFERREPDAAEIEREMAGGGVAGEGGGIACYDGFELQRAAASMIPRPAGGGGPPALHVVLTNRLPCTYDPDGMRYHGRALVAANPALVSTTGMVEAPARPRRYYIDMMAARAAGGAGAAEAHRRHAGSFLSGGDDRLAEAAFGYALQAAAYLVTGEPFCGDRGCRLYNAHWQEDVLRLHCASGRLCGAHRAALEAHARQGAAARGAARP